jgi:hypothetical protein
MDIWAHIYHIQQSSHGATCWWKPRSLELPCAWRNQRSIGKDLNELVDLPPFLHALLLSLWAEHITVSAWGCQPSVRQITHSKMMTESFKCSNKERRKRAVEINGHVHMAGRRGICLHYSPHISIRISTASRSLRFKDDPPAIHRFGMGCIHSVGNLSVCWRREPYTSSTGSTACDISMCTCCSHVVQWGYMMNPIFPFQQWFILNKVDGFKTKESFSQ